LRGRFPESSVTKLEVEEKVTRKFCVTKLELEGKAGAYSASGGRENSLFTHESMLTEKFPLSECLLGYIMAAT